MSIYILLWLKSFGSHRGGPSQLHAEEVGIYVIQVSKCMCMYVHAHVPVCMQET